MPSPQPQLPPVDELETNIRRAAESNQPVDTNLATSDRIIARVTDGIYREPWAAFRELVANAYDADASYVVIETGQPDFQRMTVRDDGIGMSPRTLAYVLKNIGGSSKRTPVGIHLHTVSSTSPDLSRVRLFFVGGFRRGSMGSASGSVRAT